MYLGLPNPGETWTNRDRCLAEALLVVERSLNDLGVPSWIAQDPALEWEPDETVDEVVATYERHRAELSRGDGGIPPGIAITVRQRPSRSSGGDDIPSPGSQRTA